MNVQTMGNQPTDYKLVKSAALEASHVLGTRPAALIMLSGYTTTAQFIQLHDATALPADGAVPLHTQLVAANANFSIIIPVGGLPSQYINASGVLTTLSGLVACNSSTGPTKTIGAADTWFEAFIR